MGKKITILAIAFAIVGLTQPAYPQKPGKVWRIGTLFNGSPATHGHYLEWYRQGLKELGYMEGRDYVFFSRWARGKQKVLPALAKELVAAKVDVIMVSGGTPTRSAANATKKIPIVVGSASGLGTWGLVATLARPGGNVTGSTAFDPGLEGKRLELLRQAAPGARRIAFMFSPKKRGKGELKRIENAAGVLGIIIQPLPVRNLGEIEAGFRSMTRERTDALVMNSNSIVNFNRKRVAELVTARKLPAICARQKIAKTGCLMAYAPDRSFMNRSAAAFVDKILKGANPGDLPVQRPTRYNLIVNLKLAKALGFTVPPSILLRATEVIE
ncbi:MAG: ABC transporter substrate-binding protein [Alphaproteobacteria bacterium]|nr:ABC transporter substrate-binding protein [Alphaproteobacteria bacterium]